MKRASELKGKCINDIITIEVYNRLKAHECFRMNLNTMQLEDIPEVAEIPQYDVIIYSVSVIKGVDVVIIHDFLDIIFDFSLLELSYDKFIKKLKKLLTNNHK